MKALVTGGAGMIGSNLTEELVKKNYEVVVLDSFSLGKEENLAAVKDSVEMIKGDVCDKDTISRVLKGVDYVFHQAAASSSPMFVPDPTKGYGINVLGFINLLNAARDAGVKRVVHASTSSIYGNLPTPSREDQNVDPPNLYAATKFAAEHLGKLYTQQFGLETVALRYFSVYGPHERSKGEFANNLSQFLWEIKEDKQPVIYGDGSQTRDFTYAKDVAQANLLAATADNAAGEVFNIGTAREISFNELVDMINNVLGKDVKAKHIENPIKNYIAVQLADISKARQILGYEPRYTVEQGLEAVKDF
jgi:nucleoside-diphosphate-sugar epimerase